MSFEPAVIAEGISKRYRIQTGPPVTLHETLSNAMRLRRAPRGWKEFWALRDLNLRILPGERVAFLGHNGAGKSTFLKLVCRITPPTDGILTLRGRVASMLEVGTGFHPELSGRDNVFLNGAILGLRRREIIDRFQRILDFSEVGAFIDTPVKHYSNGMYVRLAFAVAAHTDPDILVIDEVLAVGDQEFKAKCIAHLTAPEQRERCMLIVSHDLDTLPQVATRGIVMHHGQMLFDGGIQEAIAFHRTHLNAGPNLPLPG